jgi:hypothetical protein
MDRTDTTKRVSVRNWLPWTTAGKSEDATRHLQNLAKIGYGSPIEKSYAKPEKLTTILIQLFAPKSDDTILVIDDGYGAMCAAAMKLGRPFINLIGPSLISRSLWEKTALPRIRAIQEMKDTSGLNDVSEDEEQAPVTKIEPGPLITARLSKSSVVKRGISDTSFDIIPAEDYKNFVASLRGYLPDAESPTGYSDRDGNRCLVIEPEQILDQVIISEAESMLSPKGELIILYEVLKVRGK